MGRGLDAALGVSTRAGGLRQYRLRIDVVGGAVGQQNRLGAEAQRSLGADVVALRNLYNTAAHLGADRDDDTAILIDVVIDDSVEGRAFLRTRRG